MLRVTLFADSAAAYTGEIVGGIVGGLVFVITAVTLILYRNWKYEQELDSLLWKVNYKDIQIKEQKDEAAGANEAPAKCNSKVTVCHRAAVALVSPGRFSLPTAFRVLVPVIFLRAIGSSVTEIVRATQPAWRDSRSS